MLRFAHRILSQPRQIITAGGSHRATCVQVMSEILRELPSCHIVIANNVDDYARSIARNLGDPDHLGIELEDIPCVMPPFEKMFIEWERPYCNTGNQMGLFLTLHHGEPEIPGLAPLDYSDTASDMYLVAFLIHTEKGMPHYDGNATVVRINQKTGAPEQLRTRDGSMWRANPCFATGLMALSFMHCKNVVRQDVTEAEGPPAKWLRRQKQPTLRYHVLEIDPMKEVLRREGGVETNGLKKALHICRGHFATYSPEHPLFGKYTGTFWKSAHVRGSLDQGAVVKDYSVNPPVSS